jgi:hypothetical protein
VTLACDRPNLVCGAMETDLRSADLALRWPSAHRQLRRRTECARYVTPGLDPVFRFKSLGDEQCEHRKNRARPLPVQSRHY